MTATWPTGFDDAVFEQGSPADVWTVNHDLRKFPSVTVVDQDGVEVAGEVSYPSPSQVVIRFSGVMSGRVFLN